MKKAFLSIAGAIALSLSAANLPMHRKLTDLLAHSM